LFFYLYIYQVLYNYLSLICYYYTIQSIKVQ